MFLRECEGCFLRRGNWTADSQDSPKGSPASYISNFIIYSRPVCPHRINMQVFSESCKGWVCIHNCISTNLQWPKDNLLASILRLKQRWREVTSTFISQTQPPSGTRVCHCAVSRGRECERSRGGCSLLPARCSARGVTSGNSILLQAFFHVGMYECIILY